MNCPDDARLNDFVDGELGPAERRALAAHLDACPTCRATVGALRELIVDARGLPTAIDPRGDLWPVVRDSIETDEPSSRGSDRTAGLIVPSPWPSRVLAVAASLAVMMTMWMIASRPGDPGRLGADSSPSAALPVSLGGPGVEGAEAVRVAHEQYLDAARRLLDALEGSATSLGPDDRRELQLSLAQIDDAIERVRAAVEEYPDDREQRRALTALYKQKVDVLWRVSRLAS